MSWSVGGLLKLRGEILKTHSSFVIFLPAEQKDSRPHQEDVISTLAGTGFLSDEDLKKALSNVEKTYFTAHRDSVMVLLMMDSGMRLGESKLLQRFLSLWLT